MRISRSIHVAANGSISEELPYDQYPLNFLKTFYNLSEALLSLLFSFFFFSCCFFAGSKLTSTLHSDQGLYEYFRSNLLLKQACVVIARQAPLSIGFSKQECWSGLPFSPPGDLSDSGIEPGSPALQADFFLSSEPPGEVHHLRYCCVNQPLYLLPVLADILSLS